MNKVIESWIFRRRRLRMYSELSWMQTNLFSDRFWWRTHVLRPPRFITYLFMTKYQLPVLVFVKSTNKKIRTGIWLALVPPCTAVLGTGYWVLVTLVPVSSIDESVISDSFYRTPRTGLIFPQATVGRWAFSGMTITFWSKNPLNKQI